MMIDTKTLHFYVNAVITKRNADRIRDPDSPVTNSDAMGATIDFAAIDTIAESVRAELAKDYYLRVVVIDAANGAESEWHPWPDDDAGKIMEARVGGGKSYGQIAKARGEKENAVRMAYKRAMTNIHKMAEMVQEIAANVEELKTQAANHIEKTPHNRKCAD